MLTEALPVLRRDPVMADLIEAHEPYDEPPWTEYERLCISIINQQLSTASATAIRERVFDQFDGELTPTAVLRADDSSLLNAGLSERKLDYLRNAARAFEDHDFTREGLADHSNDEVVDRLTEIKGIGEWTSQIYLLFVLWCPSAFPLGYLAARRPFEPCYGNGSEMTRAGMREVAEQWRPDRSVATRYLWAAYESDS
jgi:DNA-3-methyladenine glycosylase II